MVLVPLQVPYTRTEDHTQTDDRGESCLETGASRPGVPETLFGLLFPIFGLRRFFARSQVV